MKRTVPIIGGALLVALCLLATLWPRPLAADATKVKTYVISQLVVEINAVVDILQRREGLASIVGSSVNHTQQGISLRW